MEQTPTPGRQARFRTIEAAIAIAVVALALLLGAAVRYSHLRWGRQQAVPPIRAISLASPSGSMGPNEARISPDGNQVAYSAWDVDEKGNFAIYVQTVGNEKPLRLTTNRALQSNPVWSPDGRYIAFRRHNAREDGIYVVPASGGPGRKLLTSNRRDFDAVPEDWSPDGKFLAYSESKLPGIWLLALDNPKESRPLIAPPKRGYDYFPRFSPDGQTVAFVRDADIFLARTAGGEPKRLTFGDTGVSALDWTPDGAYIVFLSYRQGEGIRLLKVSVSGGQPERLSLPPRFHEGLSLARHGHRLLFTQHEENSNIWRYEVLPTAAQSAPPTKLIASTGWNFSPQYSPDGKKVAFISSRTGYRGNFEVWICNPNGSNPQRLTFFNDPDCLISTPRWSPDGREIIFSAPADKHEGIYVLNAERGPLRRVTIDDPNPEFPSWSRDRKWIYFGSKRSGTWQVWKIPAEGGHALQLTKKGGYAALESSDGKSLYYAKKLQLPVPGFRKSEGLWRVPAGGGKETLVLEGVGPGMYDSWGLTEQGIYFYDHHTDAIEFFSFDTRRITQIGKPEKPGGSVAVSPDGRSILYSQEDVDTSHIMLIEDFHW